MATFHVVISGHIDKTRKPEALPDVIHQVWVHDVESPVELAARIQESLQVIVTTGGMVARLNPFQGMEAGKLDKRVWVPIHMITYFETEVKQSIGEMPQPDPDIPGEFVDKQGRRVGKQ